MTKIAQERRAAGLTQAEMGKIMDIPKRTIEAWEMGERKPPKYVERLIIQELKRIAKENG